MKNGSHLLTDMLWFLLVPPAGALAWLLMSGGLVRQLGTEDDPAVRGWTRSGFWIVLAALYAVGFAMLSYKYFFM